MILYIYRGGDRGGGVFMGGKGGRGRSRGHCGICAHQLTVELWPCLPRMNVTE